MELVPQHLAVKWVMDYRCDARSTEILANDRRHRTKGPCGALAPCDENVKFSKDRVSDSLTRW